MRKGATHRGWVIAGSVQTGRQVPLLRLRFSQKDGRTVADGHQPTSLRVSKAVLNLLVSGRAWNP